MFNHDLVTRYKLNRISIDGKRYYVLPDGTKLKSVTTVIDEKSDKKHLNAWKKRVGIEEATKISNIATRRGTAIHTIAENYVLNKSNFYDGAMPNNIVSFKPIKTVLDEHVDNIRVELGLFSKALKCAGCMTGRRIRWYKFYHRFQDIKEIKETRMDRQLFYPVYLLFHDVRKVV